MPSPLTLDDLDYDLPADRIARTPARPRDRARMLVVHRSTGAIEHRHVADIHEYLDAGDLLCMNNSAVMPARIEGSRSDTGGRIDGLVLDSSGPLWTAMLRSNGTLRAGQPVDLVGPDGTIGRIRLVDRDEARWRIEPEPGLLLEAVGHTPLPPYILKARAADEAEQDESTDRDWYRTVYQDPHAVGSVAAPTAGFHFTDALLNRLLDDGIEQAMVTLHVGAGTFAPITTERVEDHPMHEEVWSIDAPALESLASRRGEGATGRIVAVGTTTVRVLESLPTPLPDGPAPMGGRTDLLIVPGWDFRLTDAMLTNFHLPQSTLLALVGAFMGLEDLKNVYREAVESGYRFYSYGDAMLIL